METREGTKETFPALWLLGCKSDSRSGGKNCIERGESFNRRDLPGDWGCHVQLRKRRLEPGPYPRYSVSFERILPVEFSAGNGLSVLAHLFAGLFCYYFLLNYMQIICLCPITFSAYTARKHFLPGEITVLQVFLSLSRKTDLDFVYVSAMLVS